MKELTKVYIYTRVSTTMQVDGYSLDAQKEKIRRLADLSEYKIVGEYSDEGKSGKSIEGRPEFQQMLKDIEAEKDSIKYVMVFKLSRFGRNTLDILSSLDLMKKHEVHLISVEDNLYSDSPAGKIMISILSSIAEIERENILVQTMAGRMEKARQGKWNGGFAPYGYKLEHGKLLINEAEAEAVRIIFDKYANTDMGSVAITKYLVKQGINKIPRQNGQNELFSETMIRGILDNPVYAGKIAFGRRKTEKIKGTERTHIVKSNDYEIYEGEHEAIISEELWELVKAKRILQAKKYEKVNSKNGEHVHILTGLIKCPICGAGLYGNKSIKRKNGKHYKDYFYYSCKHRTMREGHKCTFIKQLHEEKLNNAVAEVVSKLVQNPEFSKAIQEKINMRIDLTEINTELENLEKQYKRTVAIKDRLNDNKVAIDPFDKHYELKVADIDKQIEVQYDLMVDLQEQLDDCRTRKKNLESEKMSGDEIYKILVYFDKLYDKMEDTDKQRFFKSLIEEIQIYEEPVGKQWLKSIRFSFPLLGESNEISLDKESSVETVVLLSHKKPDSHINVKVEFGEGEGKVPLKAIAERAEAYKPKERVTYKMIKEYIEAKYGFKVHTAYIAEVKRDLGLPMYDAPNAVEELKQPRKHPTAEKVEAIKDALKHFGIV